MSGEEPILYEELLRLLREALQTDADALRLAERLVAVFRSGGPKAVREELMKMVGGVVEGAPEAEEA